MEELRKLPPRTSQHILTYRHKSCSSGGISPKQIKEIVAYFATCEYNDGSEDLSPGPGDGALTFGERWLWGRWG